MDTTTTAITGPTNPYLHTTPAPPPTSTSSDAFNNLGRRLDSAAKKAETFAGNLYNHLRIGPGMVDVAMTRLDQAARIGVGRGGSVGSMEPPPISEKIKKFRKKFRTPCLKTLDSPLAARVIADGGCRNVFKKEFGDIHGEKLKETFVCYLSTTTGPVLGTLYVSNKRVGFKSDNPVWTGYGGAGQWVYYKVIMMAEDVVAVNPSGRPGEKYVVVLTKDGHEFWLMGFVFYDKALKCLNKVVMLHNFNTTST